MNFTKEQEEQFLKEVNLIKIQLNKMLNSFETLAKQNKEALETREKEAA